MSFLASSRRFLAVLGATSMTARAMAARRLPGVSRPARSSTLASAALASSGSRVEVARTMISALGRVITPSRSAAIVPGSRVARCHATVSIQFA